MIKRLMIVALLLILVMPVAAIHAQDDAATQTPGELCAAAVPAEDPDTREYEAADDVLVDGVDYYAIFCTDVGPIYIDLYEDETPVTVNNFVFLADNGFYNNSIFHRVIAGFMAQAGDPVGNPVGTGGPGYQFEDEIIDGLSFDRGGLLAMANAGPGTNGSQFFITYDATPWLDGAHTIFGEVIVGQNIADSVLLRDPALPEPNPATALETILIITDPSTVEAVEFVPPPASREEVETTVAELATAAGGAIDNALGLGASTIIGADSTTSGVFDVADWADTLADAEAFTSYAEATGVEYHVQANLINTACDYTQLPVQGFSYGFDVFADADAASAALDSDELVATLEAEGFSPADVEAPDGVSFYLSETSACDTEGLLVARAISQIGRFVVASDFTFVSGAFEPDAVDEEVYSLITTEFNGALFGSLLRDVLIPELN